MALLAQTVNPESNLMAGLEINGAVGPLIFLWLTRDDACLGTAQTPSRKA